MSNKNSEENRKLQRNLPRKIFHFVEFFSRSPRFANLQKMQILPKFNFSLFSKTGFKKLFHPEFLSKFRLGKAKKETKWRKRVESFNTINNKKLLRHLHLKGIEGDGIFK